MPEDKNKNKVNPDRISWHANQIQLVGKGITTGALTPEYGLRLIQQFAGEIITDCDCLNEHQE